MGVLDVGDMMDEPRKEYTIYPEGTELVLLVENVSKVLMSQNGTPYLQLTGKLENGENVGQEFKVNVFGKTPGKNGGWALVNLLRQYWTDDQIKVGAHKLGEEIVNPMPIINSKLVLIASVWTDRSGQQRNSWSKFKLLEKPVAVNGVNVNMTSPVNAAGTTGVDLEVPFEPQGERVPF